MFVYFQDSARKIPAKVFVKIIVVSVRTKQIFIEFLILLLAEHAAEIQVFPAAGLSWETRFRTEVFNRVNRRRAYRETIAEGTVVLRLLFEGMQKEFVDRFTLELRPIEPSAWIVQTAAFPSLTPSFPPIHEKIWLADALKFPHL
jgi:hypothetical protein